MINELLKIRQLYINAYGTTERDFYPKGEGVVDETTNGIGAWAVKNCAQPEVRDLIVALLQFAADLKDEPINDRFVEMLRDRPL